MAARGQRRWPRGALGPDCQHIILDCVGRVWRQSQVEGRAAHSLARQGWARSLAATPSTATAAEPARPRASRPPVRNGGAKGGPRALSRGPSGRQSTAAGGRRGAVEAFNGGGNGSGHTPDECRRRWTSGRPESSEIINPTQELRSPRLTSREPRVSTRCSAPPRTALARIYRRLHTGT